MGFEETTEKMPTETATMRVPDGMPAEHVSAFARFMQSTGIHGELPGRYTSPDTYSDIITASLSSDRIDRGKITWSLNNTFGGLHGGAIAVVAERVDRLRQNRSWRRQTELTVDGSVIRTGRNMTMVAIDFKIRDTGKLVYTARATFYTTTMAKL